VYLDAKFDTFLEERRCLTATFDDCSDSTCCLLAATSFADVVYFDAKTDTYLEERRCPAATSDIVFMTFLEPV
jgi:hypothetical protein